MRCLQDAFWQDSARGSLAESEQLRREQGRLILCKSQPEKPHVQCACRPSSRSAPEREGHDHGWDLLLVGYSCEQLINKAVVILF